MSRNFELLSQIEADFQAPAYARPSKVNRGLPKVIHSDAVGRGCSDEMVRLVQRVFLSGNGNVPRRVVFCGVDAENGSSSVCAQAGRVLAAKSSQSVCLIDANIRSHKLSKIIGVNASGPVSHGAQSLHPNCEQIDRNLWLAGTNLLGDDFGSLLSVDELTRRLAEMHTVFDYLLIDAPGATLSGDAMILGQVADATVLVIEANKTRRLTARKAKETLDAAGARLLGTVMHDRSFSIPSWLYNRL